MVAIIYQINELHVSEKILYDGILVLANIFNPLFSKINIIQYTSSPNIIDHTG